MQQKACVHLHYSFASAKLGESLLSLWRLRSLCYFTFSFSDILNFWRKSRIGNFLEKGVFTMSDALINGLAGAGGGIIAQLITYPLQTVRIAPDLYVFPVFWVTSAWTSFWWICVGKYTSTNRAWCEEGEEEDWNHWTSVSGLFSF